MGCLRDPSRRRRALVTRFQGWEDLYLEPVWEHRSTFVLVAGYDCDYGPGNDCAGRTIVRCTVRGVCEQVAKPDGVVQVQERRLPPS